MGVATRGADGGGGGGIPRFKILERTSPEVAVFEGIFLTTKKNPLFFKQSDQNSRGNQNLEEGGFNQGRESP